MYFWASTVDVLTPWLFVVDRAFSFARSPYNLLFSNRVIQRNGFYVPSGGDGGGWQGKKWSSCRQTGQRWAGDLSFLYMREGCGEGCLRDESC